MNHDPAFKNAYCKTRRYPYNARTLEFLSNKTSLFLLQYFQNMFYNCGKSGPKKTSKKKKVQPTIYQLATLGKEVDLRCLPTAYSTAYPPQPGLCDSCKLPFIEDNGTVFICGHAYHSICYSGRCIHCEEFYKKGIFKNVDSFLKRIEKGANTFTLEDLDDDDDGDNNDGGGDDDNDTEGEEGDENSEKALEISSRLTTEINQINFW